MSNELEGMKVAILLDQGVEQIELDKPRQALKNAGAETYIVSPRSSKVRAWNQKNWGNKIHVDVALDYAHVEDFDALMLPGGLMNPDRLRMHMPAVELVRAFYEADKPIAANGHAPWLLIEAGIVQGRRMTSYPSLMTDLDHAGASWLDEPVVRDGMLLTSRMPDDIPVFNRRMIAMFKDSMSRERVQAA